VTEKIKLEYNLRIIFPFILTVLLSAQAKAELNALVSDQSNPYQYLVEKFMTAEELPVISDFKQFPDKTFECRFVHEGNKIFYFTYLGIIKFELPSSGPLFPGEVNEYILMGGIDSGDLIKDDKITNLVLFDSTLEIRILPSAKIEEYTIQLRKEEKYLFFNGKAEGHNLITPSYNLAGYCWKK